MFTLQNAALSAIFLAALAGCGGGDDDSNNVGNIGGNGGTGGTANEVPATVQGTVVKATQMNDIDLNTILLNAKEGDTITLPPGKFNMLGPLQIYNKNKITLMGSGNGSDPSSNTILSFKNALTQNGIDASGLDTITFKKFAIEDASGNGLFVTNSKNILMDTLRSEWTINPFGTSTMAYGLYPVKSDNIVIINSKVIGTRDAGVYVGQSTNIRVANNDVSDNVAGVEIENSHNAIVEDNLVHDNTGGILIFSLPGPTRFKDTKNILVRNNTIIDNNTPPFSNATGLVLTIPPGTGVMVIASQNVEVTGNTISRHKTTGVLLVSAYAADTVDNTGTLDDHGKPYDNFIRGNYVHKNTITDFGTDPGGPFKQVPYVDFTNPFMTGYKKFPAVIWDGIVDPATGKGVDTSTGHMLGGTYVGDQQICSKNNGITPPSDGVGVSYENLDLNLFGLLTGTSNFNFPSPSRMDCTISLPLVTGKP